MNEFKSKTNIPGLCNPYETKVQSLRDLPHKNSTIYMALFSREDHFFHLFLPTLVNVLFLHKHVQILLVGLFMNILPNWNVLFNF